MKVQRENIFDYIAYIHRHLEGWNTKLTPDTHVRLEKIYEDFVQGLTKNKKDLLSEEQVKRLEHSIIAIVAQDKDDQLNLSSNFQKWNRFYIKEEPAIERLKNQLKPSFYIPLIAVVLSLLVLTYLNKRTKVVQVDPHVENIDVVFPEDSLLPLNLPITVDIHDLIEFDSIRHLSVEEKAIDSLFTINLSTEASESEPEPFSKNDSIWRHKQDRDTFETSFQLNNGILYRTSENLFNFNIDIFSIDSSTISFFVKSKKNFFGRIKKQEIRFNINVLEKHNDRDSLGTFPKISYQDYPFPGRSLQALIDQPNVDQSFLGKYKIPISLLISFLVWLLYYFRSLRSNDTKAQKTNNTFGHPYFWKIAIPSISSIDLPEELDKKIHVLRSKIPSGRNTLNVPRTIHKTVQSGGFVNFQYVEESLKAEFLFLIGYHSQSDHKASLWNAMANGLNAKDINTSVFHYNRDIRLCYNEQFPNGISLKALHNHYANSVLVIIGDHYNFLNPSTGKLNNWINVFENWTTRYLLTSKNYYEWDKREAELAKSFHLLPAKLSSLACLEIRPADGEEMKYTPNPDEHYIDYQAEFTASDIKISFNSAQKDWIAGCCLFPNLHYDLSLGIGKTIYAKHEKVLSAKDIEEVFSLAWFTEGKIPKEIRKTLIEDFEKRNLSLVDDVRKYITQEVTYSNPPEGSHASDWFNEGVLINEMLNKTSPPDLERKEAIEFKLKEIYERGLVSDIQIEKRIENIKSPPKFTLLKRWLSKFENLEKLLTFFSLFIIPYIFLTVFFSEEKCVGTLENIHPIPINYKLSANFYNADSIAEAKSIGNSNNSKICKTSIEEESSILEENKLRRAIYLGEEFATNGIFSTTYDDQEKELYSEEFRKNIVVDLLNIALYEASELKEMDVDQIYSDANTIDIATQFCDRLIFSDGLLNREILDSKNKIVKHEFEDSLVLCLNWCVNVFKVYSKPIAISEWNKDGVRFNTVMKYLKSEFPDNEIDETVTRIITSPTSKILFSQKEDAIIASKMAEELSKQLGENIFTELSDKQEVSRYKFYLFLADQKSDTECISCEKRLIKKDLDPPVFVQPQKDISIYGNSDNCATRVSWKTPEVKDNCGVVELKSSHNPEDKFDAGETVVTYTAVDYCGNQSTLSFKVIIICRADIKFKVVNSNGKGIDKAIIVYEQANFEKTIVSANGGFFNIQDPNKEGLLRISLGPLGKQEVFKLSKLLTSDKRPILIELDDTTLNTIFDVNSNDENPNINETIFYDIYGIVMDEKNLPLIGANLSIKGTNEVATTDKGGKFQLAVPEGSTTLLASKNGFNDEVVDLQKVKNPLQITLKATRNTIDFETNTLILNGTILADKRRVIGANIILKGTGKGTVSDLDGNFTLPLSEKNRTIIISYKGFKTQEITVPRDTWSRLGKQAKKFNVTL